MTMHPDSRRPAPCHGALVLVGASILVSATPTLAQNPVDDAVSWLASVQNPSGSWGSTTEFTDSATVVEALAAVDPTATALSDGAAWLAAQAAPNHQSLARQARALSAVTGYEFESGSLAAAILAAKNPVQPDDTLPNWPEGGWGVAPGFETDCMSTALALLALQAMGMTGGFSVEDEALGAGAKNVHEWDIAVEATIARILITVSGSDVRLRMREGSPPTGGDPFFLLPPGTFLIVFPDSGLDFTPGQNFISIESTGPAASYGFVASYLTPTLDTAAFGEALDYLAESQNADGGWGLTRGSPTELYTTLHVLLALTAWPDYDLDVERAAGRAYLLGEQLPGGGFGFDGLTPISYVTALAAHDLLLIETYPFSTAVNDAVAALLGMQDPGGSWDLEAYHTAVSILAYWDYNQPPIADAGPDQVVTDSDGDGSEDVMLSGSGSSDVDGTIERYSWTEGGTEIATGEAPTVTLPTGEHEIELTVEDDGGRTAQDSVGITVHVLCEAVTDLSCSSVGADVQLTWTNVSAYTGLNVYRDAVLIATEPAGTTSYLDPAVPTGTYTYTVEGVCVGPVSAPGTDCVLSHEEPCTEVSGPSCVSADPDVQLSWTNGEAYAAVNVYRDAVLIATLGGGATGYTDPSVPAGTYTYGVEGVCPPSVEAPLVECTVDHVVCDCSTFCRAKVTSAGCTPSIGRSGLPTVTGADDFFVTVDPVVGQSTGVLLWSLLRNFDGLGGPVTFGVGRSPRGGIYCLIRPRVVATESSGGTLGFCDGSFSFHFSQAFMGAEGLAAGTTVYVQCFFDDPAHPDGTGVGHSDALEFTLLP